MPCMECEAFTIFYLAFYNKIFFWVILKKNRVGAKIRVGRVIGNEHFLGLRNKFLLRYKC